MSASVARIAARLDRLALDQLRAEAARLAAENESLREKLYWAEQAAESWREDAIAALDERCARTGEVQGLTMSGHLVAVPPSELRQ